MYFVKTVTRLKNSCLNPSFVGLVITSAMAAKYSNAVWNTVQSPYFLNIFRFSAVESQSDLCFRSKATFGRTSQKFIFSAPTTSMETNFSWDVHSKFRCNSTLGYPSKISDSPTFPKSFCEWLAGIVDGVGRILITKKKDAHLYVTVGLEDLPLLRYIHHKFGGKVYLGKDGLHYCYRIINQINMTKLMNSINGHIRHSIRLHQLHRACQALDIPVILPITLDARSNWFAGFFDANGIVDIDTKHVLPQLSIRVTDKLLQDVEPYKVVFGGNIYYGSGRKGYYQWSVQSRKDIIAMRDYFKSSTFRSHKSRRFFLIETYYRLYDLEAFKPESSYHKEWVDFLDTWDKLTI